MFKELNAGVKNTILDNNGLLGHHLKHRYETALCVKPRFCSKLFLVRRHTLHNARNSKVEIAFWAVERANIHKQVINSHWSQNQNSELTRTRFTWTNAGYIQFLTQSRDWQCTGGRVFYLGFRTTAAPPLSRFFSAGLLPEYILSQFEYSMFKGNILYITSLLPLYSNRTKLQR